ncbi:MAG: hypothetical protein K8M05_15635, partial [Deltaproteobacteria bacterium]|nr:hypothetical protein [Kofleriaceae bacterium]
RRALGVNALDEVPDSTWFENRIGARDLSLDELRRGPAVVGSPEAHRPWTVRSSKVGGASAGFIITDARGERFILKFDLAAHPEVETGADAITSRLLWAVGYNVPEDHVVYFRPGDLVVAPDATVKDVFGNKRPLTPAAVRETLAAMTVEPDGRIRGLASRFLDGVPLGGHPSEGVRPDDPNDRIPHELRRDLRGAYAFFSWLDHVDVKEDNTLDMWVPDAADPSRHHVRHYLIDFGKSLGAMAAIEGDHRRGYTYVFDPADMFASLVTAGWSPRPWAERHRDRVPLRGVGLFSARGFDPGRWKPYTAAYAPFHAADRLDQLWAAKILMRFSRAQLRAVVEAARYSDPRAAEHITDVLVARQRAIGRYWFSRTAPLDGFRLRATPGGGVTVCFDDLLLTYDLLPARRTTRYEIDVSGIRTVARPGAHGHACTGALALSAAGDGYTEVRIRTRRPGFDGLTTIHLARGPGGPRIIGVWRS